MNQEFWNQEEEPAPKKGVKVFVSVIIIFLVIINTGLVLFFWQTKKIVNGFTGSAKQAASREKWNPLKAFADTIPLSQESDGQEPENLPRYANSVKTSLSEFADGSVEILYETKDNSQAVLAFYRSQLAQNDWLITEASDQSVKFVSGEKTININIIENTKKYVTSFKVELLISKKPI